MNDTTVEGNWALAPDVSMVGTEYGGVLLDQVRGVYWQLNRTGAQVLDGLLRGEGPQQVAQRLAAEHGEGGAQVHEDVRALIRAMAEAGLVRPEGAQQGAGR